MSKTESENVVSVSSRGQATIPKQFREELGIDTPGHVKFVRTDEGEVVVRSIHSVTDLRGTLEGNTDKQGRSAPERNMQRTTPMKRSCGSATPMMTRPTHNGSH